MSLSLASSARRLLAASFLILVSILAGGPAASPAVAASPTEIKHVDSGDGFTCAVRFNGTITCFGENGTGQLGNGTTDPSTTPTQVQGIGNAVSISAGRQHACALLSDATVKCWGSNTWWQVRTPIGNVNFQGSYSSPVTVNGFDGAVSVAAGTDVTCAVLTDGTMRCTGTPQWGGLGTGRTSVNGSDFPVATVAGINDAVSVVAGNGPAAHVCAIRQGGKVSCWGFNQRGQVGNGTRGGSSPTPSEVDGLTGIVGLALGGMHSCARNLAGNLWCWGDSSSGQVGNSSIGEFVYWMRPQALGLAGVNAVVAGDRHTCALVATGRVYCWGAGDLGQDGNLLVGGFFSSPAEVPSTSVSPSTAMYAGQNGTCLLETPASATVSCWGAGMFLPASGLSPAYAPTRFSFDAPVTTDDVPTDGRSGPWTVTLSVQDVSGQGTTTTYEIRRRNETFTDTRTYDAANKPVLRSGEAIRYRSTSATGAQETSKTSAALGGALQGTVDRSAIDVGVLAVGEPLTVNVTYTATGGDMPTLSAVPDTTGSALLEITDLPASARENEPITFSVKVTAFSQGEISTSFRIVDDSDEPVVVRVTGQAELAFDGGPAFTRQSLVRMPARISQVAVAAFDRDPYPDVAASSAHTGQVWVLQGRGNGTLLDPVELQGAAGPGQTGLATGDLNGDAYMDITTGDRLFLNNGAGQFGTGRDTGLTGKDVAVGDIDSDGDEDMVLITDTSILVASNDGAGNFATPRAYAVPNPSGLLLADVDRDGDLDIVTSTEAADYLTLLRGDGNGALAEERLPVGRPSKAIAFGDLTGDLRRDLSTGDRLLPGLADGSFGAARDGGQADEQLLITDFDGDRRDDQLTTSHYNGTITLRRGDGQGGFAPADDYDTYMSGDIYRGDLTAADFDRDARLDAVFARDTPYVEILRNGRGAQNVWRPAAKITEVQFGDIQYVKITNTQRNGVLRMDGWRVWFSSGFHATMPLSSPVGPGASVYVGAPANAGGARYAPLVRSEFRMPWGLTSVRVDGSDSTPADAVGFSDGREGGGLPVRTFIGDGAYVRKSVNGAPQDTDDNAADFLPLDTRAMEGQDLVLGSPRPDPWDAPTNRNDILQSSLVDPSKAASASPNRVTGGGFMTINRTITNCSGGIDAGVCANADKSAPAVKVTKLRFRVTALSTYGTSSGALLRLVASDDARYGDTSVRGLPLDAPSPATGGGINASQVATQLLPGDGLDPGESINVAFRLKIDRGGPFTFGYDTEDDLVELPKPAAPPTAAESVPEAPPAPDVVKGAIPMAAAAAAPETQGAGGSSALTLAPAAPAPASTAPAKAASKVPAKAKPKKRCVSRNQFKRLRGKARARAKVCAPKVKPTAKPKKTKKKAAR